MKHRTRFAVVACLLALGIVACGPSGPSELEVEQQAEWEALQEVKSELDAKREELAELKQQVAAAAEEAAEEVTGEEGEPAAVPTAEDVKALEAELAEQTEEFTGRLVQFLNADPMIEGEPPSERQMAALRMKSDEDLILAQEWIDKGGDYKKAIDIYSTTLRFDPDNEDVKAALANAEAMRFMSEERFAAVKKGMSEAEVRAALGQVNLHNRKEFPDRNVVAWFYPTSDDGAAAAVWFEQKNDKWLVYRAKFDEVKPKSEQES